MTGEKQEQYDDQPQRISLRQLLEREGYTLENRMDAYQKWSFDGAVPAMCSEGCDTEPDGTCEHGFPSALMALGII